MSATPRPTAPRRRGRSAGRGAAGPCASAHFSGPRPPGRFEWNVGIFRTDLDNDILTVPSNIISTGFFENAGNTRRQGVEAGITYRDEKWQVGANYSLIDATFQSAVNLS